MMDEPVMQARQMISDVTALTAKHLKEGARYMKTEAKKLEAAADVLLGIIRD